ncbi:thioredoxin domain protein YyaL [Syntrophotalea carbinolica DSM 2380]|uniref:Thioredoxin domain protein YyaL n=1 Tax=Syntrophotalea carbinolica (strain DSM 2380 / NBRC 103641 / GraBd1) TaxID=338963 RepID=Q3A3P9_SYNC1|nr:thioredoxin domain-containing protein [Syntrophotalea carbinolica]ABA89008.1 thioredoxin domain protein YyaL [Syntrophotalea carbinolica DSM 2380]
MTNSQDRENLVSRLSEIDTSLLPPDGGDRYNRLIFESSPYLLQHATNPVDWHPWGQQAFDLAREQNKPVLVSIGYSTCHWCHVMEQESFEDREVAEVLNKLFIPIKVDREERPDIDNLYMTACQLVTGGGGWPLNVFLTPDKAPFYAATYMPRRPRGQMPGIIAILTKIGAMWQSDRDQLLQTGREIGETLIRLESSAAPVASSLTEAPLTEAFERFKANFDHERGGFGKAPKFPMPHNLSLLFHIAQRFGQETAEAMAIKTLQHIRLGGMYDHIGFGMHRYSVDAFWRVPHFEKMLYDQALVTLAALDAYQVTHDTFFESLADQTMSYVLRDLSLPEGGFCSGEDADTEGAEGTFYLWTPQQVEEVLGHQQATIFCTCYEISEAGNFEGSNIPRLEMDLKEWAQWFGTDTDELGAVLEDGRRKLLQARKLRVRPHRDDKVLVAWNGLAIAAMARTARLIGHPEYLEGATRAADFILSNMRNEEGRLLRRWRRGQAGIPAFLEDYAALILGLIELYQAGFNARYLAEAVQLGRDMQERFGTPDGVYYDTGTDAEEVLVRKRTLHDGAMISGNSMAAMALLRLGSLTGEPALEEHAEKILLASSKQWTDAPTASGQLLMALDLALSQREVLVIAAPKDDPEGTRMVKAAHTGFRPNLIILWHTPDDNALSEVTPLVRGKTMQNGKATAYLCRGQTCMAPATTVDQLLERLNS